MGLFGNKGFNGNAISFRCEKVNVQALPKGLSIKQGDFFNAYPTSDSGQFGSLATFKRGNKLYAIKYLDKNWTPTKADEIKDQCLEEYKKLCKIDGLNDCSVASAPKAYAFGEVCTNKDSNRYPAIVMDYIEDPSLFEAIERGLISENPVKRINAKTTIQIAINIAEGYNSLHKVGIIHRDGSQNNIRISLEDGHHITFLDFGNSINLGTARRTFTRGATPYFGAPEVFNKNANRNHASQDLWTLGALIYYIRYGKKPHETLIEESNGMPSDYLEIKENHPLDLVEALGSSNLQKGDEELAAFILSCTQFNIQDRINNFKNNNGAFSFSCAIEQLKGLQISVLGKNKSLKNEKPHPYKLPLHHSMALKITGEYKSFSKRFEKCTEVAEKLSLWIDTVEAEKRKEKHALLIRIKETESSQYPLYFPREDFDVITTVLQDYLGCTKMDTDYISALVDCFVFENEEDLAKVSEQCSHIKNELYRLNLQTNVVRTSEQEKPNYSLCQYNTPFNATCHYRLAIDSTLPIKERIERYQEYLKTDRLTAVFLSQFSQIAFVSRYAMRDFMDKLIAPTPLIDYFDEILPNDRLIVFDQEIAKKIIVAEHTIQIANGYKIPNPDLDTIKCPCLIWTTDNSKNVEWDLDWLLNNSTPPYMTVKASEAFYLEGLPLSQLEVLTLKNRIELLSAIANKAEEEYTIDDYRLITSLLNAPSRIKLKGYIENANIPIPDAYRIVISCANPWVDRIYNRIDFKFLSTESKNYTIPKIARIISEQDCQYILKQMDGKALEIATRLIEDCEWPIHAACGFVMDLIDSPKSDLSWI